MALLEVFIGLFFIYVLLSLFASIIQELVSGIVSLRGRTLVQALAKLLEFDDPRERLLLKRYLRHENSSYKKLVSSNLGVRRLPSYLSRDQLIAVIQELANVRENIVQHANEREAKTEQRDIAILQSDIPLKKIRLSNKEVASRIEKRITEEGHVKSYKEAFLEEINRFKKSPKELLKLKHRPDLKTPKNIEIRWNDIFPWRWVYFKIYRKVEELFRRKNKNRDFIVGNLPVLEYRMNNIQQTKLKNALRIIDHQARKEHHVSADSFAIASNELFEMYDDFMNRARGWFKRKVQFYLIATGFLIAFYTNSDTIEIFNKLSSDPLARSEVVRMAETFVANNDKERYTKSMSKQDSASIDSIYSKLNRLMENELAGVNSALGLGWEYESFDYIKASEKDGWFKKLCATIAMPFDLAIEIAKETNKYSFKWIGFLLTALAISLGANFWFDLLKRLINIRNAGVRPDSLGQNNAPPPHSHTFQQSTATSFPGMGIHPSERIVG